MSRDLDFPYRPRVRVGHAMQVVPPPLNIVIGTSIGWIRRRQMVCYNYGTHFDSCAIDTNRC
ncbi:MAG: hypothetical protein IT324_12340 [Anaerolineae bacterium]|nr:hypothetical protein [Anaerolineae bacterium]